MCFLIFNMDKGVIFVLDEKKNITLFEFEVKIKVIYLKITQSVSFFLQHLQAQTIKILYCSYQFNS